MFADSLANGEVSYMFRKYGFEYYEVPESRQIDEEYRKAFEQKMEEEVWNDNSQHFGIDRVTLLKRLKESDGIYTMLFEYLER